MKSFFKKIFRDLKLFFQSPKDFLYSYKYSNKKFVEIYPFDPDSLTSAKGLMEKIKKECPDLHIYLIGSVGLGIDGRGDVDLYAATQLKKIPGVSEKISKLFGEPVKTRNTFIEWNFRHNGTEVELVLTDPNNEQFKKQIELFNLLKRNKKFLNEYKELKSRLKKYPEREYVRKRMEFFNRILSTSGKL